MQAPLGGGLNNTKPRAMLVGNWKMHGLKKSLQQLQGLTGLLADEVVAVLCLPATLINEACDIICAKNIELQLGAQDCHWQQSGAYTGDISALMLKDSGASYVLLGHGERRKYHCETNELIAAKAQIALHVGLLPIICIGETEDVRRKGEHFSFLKQQLMQSLPSDMAKIESIAVAYEPLWAIGTGNIAQAEEIAAVHSFIRAELLARYGNAAAQISLLYGGSVKADNVGSIVNVPHVNGVLVGGASLLIKDFLQIYDIIKKNIC
ncbi:triose-phosphate isomerase [Bartonella sp. TP]|uniref:triose-phosphate isomerase n=1 Tax=Bartonella sp. TP TaxID=3057550 RepID=UPI0025AF5C58|nr:triose-phosphate isomerase [Bartonella sp. TP]WJW80100.1 triose-phosphate isomerase [Bartonella sp. TP]